MMSKFQMLAPGQRELRLYGDGSLRAKTQVGAWAFYIPTFGISGVGAGRGAYAERFELAAFVEGVGAICAVDRTARPIHLHTDSEFVLTVIKHVAAGQDLAARPSYCRVHDLTKRVIASAVGRELVPIKCGGDDSEHRKCHSGARRFLRAFIRNDVALGHEMALKRETQRLEGLLETRLRLEQRIERVDQELLTCEMNSVL
jgi:ribonuclease HI